MLKSRGDSSGFEQFVGLVSKDAGVFVIICGKPVVSQSIRQWHLTLAIKDGKRKYVGWPETEVLQRVLNELFNDGVVFSVEVHPGWSTDGPIVNLISRLPWEPHHRRGRK